ncbi:hypothetical protein [Jeotgalicoccus sp. ATCC 8456]|uniref:hypothetical protein n=1 Tax=Jeotgalicoccus sp. ATCC 8456 TaxID=946435 RepID=UPI0018E62413|nr:hypothetical protein [Jeotgalicoccus sp. ATCC 8456]QQD85138.1 hypothetical protein JEM45_00440 [Jeotgalicoccus sp. ATCC 8456]
MEKIKKTIESESWVITDVDQETISFYTDRWSYTVFKRPLFGFRMTISSIDSSEMDDYIFKTESELIQFIKKINRNGRHKSLDSNLNNFDNVEVILFVKFYHIFTQ